MNTNSLVSLIRRQAPDWGDAEIIDFINDIQLIMMSKRLNYNRVKDTTTGKDPVLTTIAGTFEYELTTTNGFPSDGYSVGKVYTGTPSAAIYGNYGYNTESTEGTIVPCHFISGTYSSNAKIIFDNDPGTNDYYVEYYAKPTRITSKSIQPSVPEEWHYTLIEGVIARIQGIEHGKYDVFNEWRNGALREFWAAMGDSFTTSVFSQISRGY